MVQDNDPLVRIFNERGVNISEYVRGFEQTIIGHTFSKLCAYITCFCKPTGEEDFKHGLLSQWRAYGEDGGYALQFSRKKLLAAVENAYTSHGLNYDLQDVYYTVDNPLKSEVLNHIDSFHQAYQDFLEELGRPLDELFNRKSMPSPLAGLTGGPLESLITYLTQTKNQHFSEERECRLSLTEAVSSKVESLSTHYFNLGSLIVPYKKTTPETFPIIDCIEWIVIGPSSRMDTRFKSITQMVRTADFAINVRPSHIPFSRG